VPCAYRLRAATQPFQHIHCGIARRVKVWVQNDSQTLRIIADTVEALFDPHDGQELPVERHKGVAHEEFASLGGEEHVALKLPQR
jgi:hypothetical protein